ncbi:DinB family protein [Streptomyces sp. NBC_01381]|uniref:DinB family protein n=1 Tax=Streptomyces sp. NBC_01381 TaxID=2903845 RepID=UPI0022586C83|nr:DinB family protein [Streptomyces sp. NBC_01381]MCX4665427.1 DinB family protein [Streptomyces sp. NBC_01381]
MVTHVNAEAPGDERGALLAFLDAERGGIRRALIGLSDERAATKPSASELSLSGLLKHVAEVEEVWISRAKGVAPAVERTEANWDECFRLTEDETVESALAYWAQVADRTEEFIRSLPTLDETFALPDQPWFPKEDVSMRWVLLRLITEMSRHSGHADIIRESLDGKTAFELVALERGESWG